LRFVETSLPGVYLIEQERHADERGWFARTWCAEEVAAHGLESRLVQCNASFNRRRGTLRGMHYQAPPFAEVKLVRCVRGALFDVAVDLRPDSPAFRRSFGIELSAGDGRALYVPRGFGHGFLTLADDTEVSYLMSAPFSPTSARGVRHDDPFLGIRWPRRVEVIAARDRDYPDVKPESFEELRALP
jgi:dTDP-4-dehydrorhamnose 3,5-epimerase